MKKILAIVLSLMLVFSVSGMAMAQPTVVSKGGKKSLVALGDSITSGYGLFKQNPNPIHDNLLDRLLVSKQAYPKLLGDKIGYRVNNLAVPGMTSGELLDALENNNRYINAIRHADLITLNIGANDFLSYLLEATSYGLTYLNNPAFVAEIVTKQATYNLYLNSILQTINDINPEAQILLFGSYNPLYEGHPYNVYSDALLPLILQFNYLTQSYASYNNVYYVNAFLAFETYGVSKAYLFVDEVHPSELGQDVLYKAALRVLVD